MAGHQRLDHLHVLPNIWSQCAELRTSRRQQCNCISSRVWGLCCCEWGPEKVAQRQTLRPEACSCVAMVMLCTLLTKVLAACTRTFPASAGDVGTAAAPQCSGLPAGAGVPGLLGQEALPLVGRQHHLNLGPQGVTSYSPNRDTLCLWGGVCQCTKAGLFGVCADGVAVAVLSGTRGTLCAPCLSNSARGLRCCLEVAVTLTFINRAVSLSCNRLRV